MLKNVNQVRARVEANLAAVEDGTIYGGKYGGTISQIARKYLDGITAEALLAKSNFTIDDIRKTLSPKSKAIIVKRFPDYQKDPTQILAATLQAVVSATSPDKVIETRKEILDANPGLGLTGPADRTPRLLLRFGSNDPRGVGTAIHDNNSMGDAINSKKEKDKSFVKRNSENKAIWGASSDEISALIMFADALADKALESIAVDEEISNPDVTLPVYQTVSDLGRVGASIGGKIAALTGNENLASQLVTESAGETLGSWIGDAISYELQGRTPLELKALLYRYSGNFVPNVIAIGSTALSNGFINAFNVRDPFAQIGVNTVTSAVTTYSFNELAIAGLGEDFAVKYLGVPAQLDPNTGELVIKNGGFAANNPPISQSILNIGASQLGSFIGSELYQAMIESLDSLSENLNAEWARYGGQIGGLAATLGLAGSWAGPLGYLVGTTIGTLLGNIIGGAIGEIVDPDFPRAAYRVGLSPSKKEFISVGEDERDPNNFPPRGYEEDKGNLAFAKEMGDAARDYLNLVVGLTGGTLISADNFYYGHYEDKIVYHLNDGNASGGSSWKSRRALPSAQEAVQAGVFKQLGTVQIEGGDPYMKQVLINLRDEAYIGKVYSDEEIRNGGSNQGSLYAYDGFNYTLGSALQGLNGGTGWSSGWATNAGATRGGTIVSGLSYTDAAGNTLPVQGGALATDPSVFFSQETRNTLKTFGTAGSSVWLSFLVKQTEAPSNGAPFSYAQAAIGTGYTFGSDAMLGGISFDDIAINPFYAGSSSEYIIPNAAPAGSASLVVLRYDFASSGSDTINLWLNPLLNSNLGAPNVSGAFRNYADLLSGITLAHGDYRTFVYDEVRIGSNYIAVVGQATANTNDQGTGSTDTSKLNQLLTDLG